MVEGKTGVGTKEQIIGEMEIGKMGAGKMGVNLKSSPGILFSRCFTSAKMNGHLKSEQNLRVCVMAGLHCICMAHKNVRKEVYYHLSYSITSTMVWSVRGLSLQMTEPCGHVEVRLRSWQT